MHSRRSHRKKVTFWVYSGLLILILAAAGWGGKHSYKTWRAKRLLTLARESAAAGKYHDAAMLATQVVHADPNNVEAARFAAEILENVNDPDAVLWRRRVLDLTPKTFADDIAYAKTAMKFDQPSVAAQALARVDPAVPKTAEFYELAGDAALRLGDIKQAEEQYAHAVDKEPANEQCALKLATARVQSGDDLKRKDGLVRFEALLKNEKFKVEALRGLVRGCASDRDWQRAQNFADQLHAEPRAVFGDQLLYLAVLQETGNTNFQHVLEELQQHALDNAAEAGLLIEWMRTHNMVGEAAGWVNVLPPKLANAPEVGAAVAPCYITTRDWNSLEALTRNADWHRLEYLRFVYLARAAKEKGNQVAFKSNWQLSLGAASGANRQAMEFLASIVKAWGWTTEWRDLLWVAATKPDPAWALNALYASFAAEKNTLALKIVAGSVVDLDQSNLVARNNAVMLTLLLGEDVEQQSKVAEQLYRTDPKNPAFASTYAFALHATKRPTEALEVMRTLPPDVLKKPSMAAYYGLILADNRAWKDAAEYLAIANGADLLPEETRLVSDAIRSLPKPRQNE